MQQLGYTDKRTDVWSRNFMIWKIKFGQWAVAWAGQWEKGDWADSEQLFWVVFSIFHGQKKFFFNFFLHCSVRTEKLHKIKLKFFGKFFGKFFWKNFLEKNFWKNFQENFFGKNFFVKFLWKIFLEKFFFGKILWKFFLGKDFLRNLGKISNP